VLIFEDPPLHDIHRKLLARMFTPRKIALLEQRIRDYCITCLDPVVGTGTFDFVTDLGAVMPMKTISALIGVPEADEQAIRDHVTGHMKTEAGRPMKAKEGLVSADVFAE
jgi:cytochrome P450